MFVTAELTGRLVLKPYKRVVLNMQGQSIAAGATLSQNIDLSGYDKAIFGCVFSAATFTGTIQLVNLMGSLWIGNTTVTVSTAASSTKTTDSGNVFAPIADRQQANLTNNSTSAVTISLAEVIAQ